MSGKNIMGGTNRAKRGEAAVQPPLATPSALHEPPGPHPLTQRGEIDEDATATPTATRTYTLDRVTRAQLATKLQGFTERSLMGIHHKIGLQLAAFTWAKNNGCPWSASTSERVATGGHLGALQWAREHGCPWDETACAAAAESGHLGVLQWAHEHGCPWDETAQMTLVLSPSLLRGEMKKPCSLC